MGAGIAQLACVGGFDTWMHDPAPDALSAGEARVHEGLAKGAARGMWRGQDAAAAGERLNLASRLEDLGGCRLVIEAAPEDLALKRELLDLRPRRDPRDEHFVALGDRDRGRYGSPWARLRYALLQPAAAHAAGRDRRRR